MASTGQGARIIGGEDDTSGPGPEIMASSTLEGDKVVNPKGEALGKIEEIMIDVERGTVAYAVMSCGGMLGLGEKLFAIPWEAFTLDARNHAFILDADRSRFENAPGFDKSHWPSMADSSWANEVHRYYGVEPYWRSSRPLN